MKKHRKQIVLDMLVFVILPFVINIILESLGNKRFLGGFEKLVNDPLVFFCNVLIVAFTLCIGLLFRRYRWFWVEIVSLLWLLLGVSNCLLLNNRVLPLTAHDLLMPELLPSMMRKYLPPYAIAVVCLIIVAAILAVIIAFVRSSRPKEKYRLRHFLTSAAVFLAVSLLTLGGLKGATSKGVLETHFYQLDRSYLKNGFAYSFMSSLMDIGVSRVDGYSQKLIDGIIAGFEEEKADEVKTPSIIFVQLESFFDLNSLKTVEFSDDPVPNFTKYSRECASGKLTVPIIGAGTINTEFEVTTGMRVTDFGAGEYPYKTVIKKNTCESVANNLREYGYRSHFIHNYRGTFYGRNVVYANLGYDYFKSIEYMSGYKVTENGWAKDDVLTRYIIQSLDSTEGPDLVTTISVQAHGSYDVKKDYERHVTVTRCEDSSKKNSFEYYANQIYETDAFIGDLIEALSQRDEEIILVAYGDHLPSLDIQNSDVEGRSIYETDYFIWNNMGIEIEDEDIFSYQLNSRVLESINIKNGVINSCHQTYKNSEDYDYNLKALEYDVLYGRKYSYDGVDPYVVSAMKKNSRTLKISSVEKKEGSEGTYVVKGSGFTVHTYVRIGTRIVSARYVDGNTLEFVWSKYEEGISVSVWERGIGSSKPYVTK